MDTLIPDLDRFCPECGCPSLSCTSTTADKWLGTCPSCGWQGWQDLPTYPLPAANESRPAPKSPRKQFRHDPKRIPITHRLSPERANKNLPSEEPFPQHPAPSARVLFGRPALDGYGYCGVGTQPARAWPRWCGAVAPIVLTAFLLACVLAEALHPGAVRNFDPFPEPAIHYEGPVPTERVVCDSWTHECHYEEIQQP